MSRPWGGVSLRDQWDEIEGVSKSAQLVWDTGTLQWVKMTQPGSGGSGGGDGAILDGSNATIKASVKNYTNAKPLTVVLVDTNGDPYTASGSAGTPSSIFHRVSTGSTNAATVKASAGTLRSLRVFNKADYPIYVKFHNTAGVPTAGAGVIETVGAQAGVTVTHDLANGAVYSIGIGITIVKDMADTGTTPVLSEDCIIDVFYN